MSFPPDLLDELARVFAQVALDQLLKDAMTIPSEAQKGMDNFAITPATDAQLSSVTDGLVSRLAIN